MTQGIGTAAGRGISEMIAEAALPLADLDSPAFADWIDTFADCRVILLGESTHGTAEFYRARARITEALVTRHGFDFVAVEADWPDAASIDRHIRQRPAPPDDDATPPFSRFPTWMWRNTEIARLTDKLYAINADRPLNQRVAFYGLDIYSMRASMSAVLAYLNQIDPAAAVLARERYACLDPWRKMPSAYGRAVLTGALDTCEREVLAQLRDMLDKRLHYAQDSRDEFFEAAQNARLVASAERYYRIMYQGSAEGWNLRDTHMFETLTQLLTLHGSSSKGVVWAHNSHIGNATATAMGKVRDEINLGQLCREAFGTQAALIGLDTYMGTVTAATDWDGATETKTVRPARADSYAHLAHDAGLPRAMLDLRAGATGPGAAGDTLRAALEVPRQQRFIGVIYRPETEFQSHYMETILPQQFDGWLWLAETSALEALPAARREGIPDTWPFGL
ncbi:erythromycin esterase family protein [Cupriavidus plantarum]|uniref:Erythromycin esterase-like protein n=1 Tax=Cupriavidus plantarum TaxID=942865 RepID=A0A316EWF0_9BURK|nr:erythromycin esterase family protein [Cupriavidus plantarum]PWK35489.1 erythromycin esterase-like protein [Cupriavidus plantarum]